MSEQTVTEIFDGMPGVFNPASAQGVDMVFQFHITGDQAGDWNVTIKDGTCQVAEGVHPDPKVAMTLKDKHWVAMATGQLNGAAAFMTGKLKIKGDIMSAQRLGSFFTLG